jgi:hypothetical protein
VAGAVTGLFATWALIGLFIGTGEFLTTFVAQYFGAGRPQRIGPAMWQGFYFSLGAGLVGAALSPLAFSSPGAATRASFRPTRPATRASSCWVRSRWSSWPRCPRSSRAGATRGSC